MSPGVGTLSDQNEDGNRSRSSDGSKCRQDCGTTAYPGVLGRHCRAQQQRQRRVTGHGVILLRSGEGEEHQNETNPAERQESRASGAINRLERQLGDRREIDAPRKEPRQMEEPEPQPRDRVVVARVAQIQEAQQLLVDEKEPQETVIFSLAAVHGEREVRRIAQGRQHVPGNRDQQNHQHPAEGMQPLPGSQFK